jgi:formylglycine-generating enzyme required for sulfatase activity
VPAGSFNRGNDVSAPASVSAFRLDKYEVTVGRFRKFVAGYTQTRTPAGAGKNPNDPESTGWNKDWDSKYLPKDAATLRAQLPYCGGPGTWTASAGSSETLPVVCIRYYDAAAFCAWDGGRLPTEAEWNYAAAGGEEQRLYPWTGVISSEKAVYTAAGALVVGSKPAGVARWGHMDLAGNVTEWVEDFNSATYAVPCEDCAVHTEDPYRVIRGGSFDHSAEQVTTAYRQFGHADTNYQGFRCARLSAD